MDSTINTGKTGGAIPMAVAAIVMGAGFLLAAAVATAEHPSEHPKEHPSEHPAKAKAAKEHPAEHPQAKAASHLSKDDLAEAITAYVAAQTASGGGRYVVHDGEAGRDLSLVLELVHKERLSKVGEQTYFACADFRGDDGVVYDLDFFMKGKAKDSLDFTEVSVHKRDGKARYNWFEKDGLWYKK